MPDVGVKLRRYRAERFMLSGPYSYSPRMFCDSGYPQNHVDNFGYPRGFVTDFTHVL
jgi:hypothetical protein